MAKPKFVAFDRIGKLMIRTHLAFTAVNQRNGRKMAKEQHWYECKCSCGSIVKMPQQELVDKRRTHLWQCDTCRYPDQPDTLAEFARKIAMGA